MTKRKQKIVHDESGNRPYAINGKRRRENYSEENRKSVNLITWVVVAVILFILLVVGSSSAKAQTCEGRILFTERIGRYFIGDTTCWTCGWDIMPQVYLQLDSNIYNAQIYLSIKTIKGVRWSHPRNCVSGPIPTGVAVRNRTLWFGILSPWIIPAVANSPWGWLRNALPMSPCYDTWSICGTQQQDTIVIFADAKWWVPGSTDTCRTDSSYILPPCNPMHHSFVEIGDVFPQGQVGQVDTLYCSDMMGRKVHVTSPGVVFIVIRNREYDKVFTKTIYNK